MLTTSEPTASLQAFDFGGEPVRVTERDGQPWFVAVDVCQILGLNNVTEATRSLETDELSSEILNSGGQNREMSCISESGLYALIFRSRKPKAKEFRRWVTSEVLPAIRRNGAYSLAASFSNPPAPVEHPAVQFITVLDAIRARGASTEKALYSIGNLFQSSLAGAYQSNRAVLPMILPPPPDPATLPPPPPPTPRGRWGAARFTPNPNSASAQGAEKVFAVLRDLGPLPYGKLREASGLDVDTMRNALRKLRKDGRISQDKNLTWSANQ